MKKLVAVVLLFVVVCSLCVACCEPPVEISREPVNVRYTEVYEGIETDVQYTYNWLKGEFVLVPITQTVRHEAKYEIQYQITYEDGKQKTEWCNCTEAEYKRVKGELIARGG